MLTLASSFLLVPSPRRQSSGEPPSPSERRFAAIDGGHLKKYVEELTAISRRYRDNGHPQFWGRITGTEGDAENARWLLEKFHAIGLSDVRAQPLDLPPQWMPASWSVVASADQETLKLETAQPTSTTPGTPSGGVELEAVDVGLASEIDLAARDLKGKAVFFYSADYMSRHAQISESAVKRIERRGAAAIFVIVGIPGNLRTQFYPVDSTVPTFSLGLGNGLAVRDLIGRSRGSQAPRVRIHLDVKTIPSLKTATVWGSLPGTTDETIFLTAHRDGWFDGAIDNASGIATMLGVAEYFAKLPQAQRRRTIVFLGTSGHHDNSGVSGHWLGDHKELFARTALIINCEHTSATEFLINRGGVVRRTNATVPLRWHAGGSRRLQDIVINAYEMFGVPTYSDPEPSAGVEIGPYARFAPSLQLIEGGLYFHTDYDTADIVPASGLTATTRAFAKIITDVNGLNLDDLVAPQASDTRR
jgi:hypothetical protein